MFYLFVTAQGTEPKVVLENAGWTVLQKTVNAVAGILWKLHV